MSGQSSVSHSLILSDATSSAKAIAQVPSQNQSVPLKALFGSGVVLFGVVAIALGLMFRRRTQGAQTSQHASIFSSKTVFSIGVFAILIGGVSVATSLLKPASSMAGMEGMSMDDMMRVDGSANPTPVTIETIQPKPFEASVRYTGTVRPYQEVTVYPRVTGQLTEYSVYPGDVVQAGQVLARLSASELSSEVDSAIAEVEAAKSDEQAAIREQDEQRQEVARLTAEGTYLATRLDRTQKVLLNSGAIAQNEFDKQKSELTAAQASLRAAKVKVDRMAAAIAKAKANAAQAEVKVQKLKAINDYRIIASPITGTVQERLVDPGVVVQPGMGILKVQDSSKVRLQVNVPQQNLAAIQIGSPIMARLVGNAAQEVRGQVTSIFPKAGEDTRTVTVEAVVENPSRRIVAGQAVEMQIITDRKLNTVSVPQTAISEAAGKSTVWIMVGQQAQRKAVTVGLTSGDRVEITSGLQPGDQVITSGQQRLIDNAKVVAVDESGQRVASLNAETQGDARIQLVSPKDKAAMGDNQLILEVQDLKTGKPLSVEGLEVSVAMQMKNMAPMKADAEIQPAAQLGQFQVKTYLGMRGDWEISAKVKDKSHQGNSTFTINNR
ncbi:hypothetical protein LEP3755_63430 (plasmid) [Leptolyngbya sp. NIES-3755]|nr:hypothetical protein LEP3755_63430 [Leptolyngbya sp. NIES-3755]